MRSCFIAIFIVVMLSGCAVLPSAAPRIPTSVANLTATQLAAGERAGLDNAELAMLINKPLYQMKPNEVGRYLAYLQISEPDLRARIAHLGRKNIGQPYEIYLLGEFPYELADEQPLYNLEKSDCVVFAEHTYAMALSRSWEEFFWVLQRIRYRDGIIGVTSRNHYTEVDWNPQNAWLLQDISATLAGERAATYLMKVDRTKFFKQRYKLDYAVPFEESRQTFVPKAELASVIGQLQEGDLVNIISSQNENYWASHVGIVVLGPNGVRHLLHSAEPAVREETFESFVARATERELRQASKGKPGKLLAGFKFLRLNDSPAVPTMAAEPRPATR